MRVMGASKGKYLFQAFVRLLHMSMSSLLSDVFFSFFFFLLPFFNLEDQIWYDCIENLKRRTLWCCACNVGTPRGGRI